MSRISIIAVTCGTLAATALDATAALASQGPGTTSGTASAFTQTAMAVVVYGVSAIVIATGLIGAARKH